MTTKLILLLALCATTFAFTFWPQCKNVKCPENAPTTRKDCRANETLVECYGVANDHCNCCNYCKFKMECAAISCRELTEEDCVPGEVLVNCKNVIEGAMCYCCNTCMGEKMEDLDKL